MSVIPHGSIERLIVPVVTDDGPGSPDPDCYLALTPGSRAPAPDDFDRALWDATDQTASWVTTGIEAPGWYRLWLRMTDADETPIRYVGDVTITP